MADDIAVKYLYSDGQGHHDGDTQSVSLEDAKRLVKAGVAVYATKPAAKAAGADPETAATATAKH